MEPIKDSLQKKVSPKVFDSPQNAFNLKSGDHLCFLYETEEEQRVVIISLILQGIKNKEKILYCINSPSPQDIRYFLSENEVEVDGYINQGRLAFYTKPEDVLKEKSFECDEFISLLRKETELAKKQGYNSIRLIYETEWILNNKEINSERILELESQIIEFFQTSRCVSICQYDRNKHDPEFLLDILSLHSLVIVGTKFYGTIEEKKRAEETKIELEKRRRKFIEITSHELRTPLTSIKGFVDILKTYYESLGHDVVLLRHSENNQNTDGLKEY
ncbi:MAG: MEDS domain-containing protein, partial [Candidatus Hodarchaeota archaeon]